MRRLPSIPHDSSLPHPAQHTALSSFLLYVVLFSPAFSSEFHLGQGRSYSSMNSIQSAVSAIASVQGQPAEQHPLVSRFLKGVFLERPSLSRCRTTWDPDLIFRHLQKLGPNNALSPIQLSRKLVIIMLLTSGQRGEALHLLDIRNMYVSASRVT
ncbi:hypothetical protein E2C01_062468 [Portunus trituberculatus]|uniref:Uncharacterized protein n=1 Tax=Portunus trituberculatus TaxID=210409 RepID=A0A5B7H7Y7_PORTR|nr:hypothetical protein [Portunus trituberculatus]